MATKTFLCVLLAPSWFVVVPASVAASHDADHTRLINYASSLERSSSAAGGSLMRREQTPERGQRQHPHHQRLRRQRRHQRHLQKDEEVKAALQQKRMKRMNTKMGTHSTTPGPQEVEAEKAEADEKAAQKVREKQAEVILKEQERNGKHAKKVLAQKVGVDAQETLVKNAEEQMKRVEIEQIQDDISAESFEDALDHEENADIEGHTDAMERGKNTLATSLKDERDMNNMRDARAKAADDDLLDGELAGLSRSQSETDEYNAGTAGRLGDTVGGAERSGDRENEMDAYAAKKAEHEEERAEEMKDIYER